MSSDVTRVPGWLACIPKCGDGPLRWRSAAELCEILETNLVAPVLLTRASLAHLGRGGVVVNVASLAGMVPVPPAAIHSASKSGRAAPNSSSSAAVARPTVVLARTAQMHGVGHVYSMEHEPEFAAKTRGELARLGLSSFATVLDAPLRRHPLPAGDWQWYETTGLPPRINLLVVDGPPMRWSSKLAATHPLLPRPYPAGFTNGSMSAAALEVGSLHDTRAAGPRGSGRRRPCR